MPCDHTWVDRFTYFWHFYNIRFPNLSAVTHVFFKCIFVRTDYKNIIVIQ